MRSLGEVITMSPICRKDESDEWEENLRDALISILLIDSYCGNITRHYQLTQLTLTSNTIMITIKIMWVRW